MILMSDACHAPSHSSSISNAFDGRRKKIKVSSWFALLQRHEGNWGDHESLRCWLMGFKQHNISVCNATCNVERDGICQPGSPRCVDVPLSHQPPAVYPNILHPSAASRLTCPRLYFLPTFVTIPPLFF